MIVRPAAPEHYGWIAERAHVVPTLGFRALEAVDDSGRIHGMVGYDGWLPGAVSMHIALEHPAAFRSLLRPCFGIVFEAPPVGYDKPMALCTVLSTNTRSLRLVDRVGFREVFRGRNWWAPGTDLVFFEMRREECRWIRKEAAWAA